MLDFKHLYCRLLTPLYTVTLYKLHFPGFPLPVSASVGWLSFVIELNSYQLFIIYHIIALFHDLPTIGKAVHQIFLNGNFHSNLML